MGNVETGGNMTLKEVLSSRKPFKRSGWVKWVTALGAVAGHDVFVLDDGSNFYIRIRDVVSTDWHIDKESKTFISTVKHLKSVPTLKD